MPEKIKLIRFKSKYLSPEIIQSIISDFTGMKNNQLIKRFQKSIGNKKRNSLFSKFLSPQNFKRNWFCKDCLTVFYLNPVKRYKSLLEYTTSCRNCNSQNTVHNEKLNKAITGNKSANELFRIAGNSTQISFNINDKSKYYLNIFSNSKVMEMNKAEKEYFYLDNPIRYNSLYNSG